MMGTPAETLDAGAVGARSEERSRGDAARSRSKAPEWFVARRYLSGGRGRGFLSLITLIAIGGVTVGVMALIVVISVMSGLQKDLREKILGASPHGMVLEVGSEVRMDDWRGVSEVVTRNPAVTAATPFIYTEVILAPSGGFSEGVGLKAIPSTEEALDVTRVDEYLIAGEMPFGETDSGHPGILLGRGLADRHGLYPGKLITVVSLQNAELTPTGFLPQMRRFEVSGIFETGLFQYDNLSDQFLSNIRLNFIHTPGADLFLVYNERRLTEDPDLIDRAIILKLTQLFRF